MRFIVTYLLLFSFILPLSAQEGFRGEHFIEVTGTAEMEVDPNEITLFIRLREFEENRNKVSLEKLDKEFNDAVKAAGIDKNKLTLADAGSKLAKLSKKEKDAFREKSYQLVLNGAPALEKFLEKIEPVKVDLITITRVHHTDMEKYKLDLKVKALQAAKNKAELLTKSINAEIGKPLMIREWDTDHIQPIDVHANVFVREKAMDYQQDIAGAEEPATVAFKKIRLRAQVAAQFEIK